MQHQRGSSSEDARRAVEMTMTTNPMLLPSTATAGTGGIGGTDGAGGAAAAAAAAAAVGIVGGGSRRLTANELLGASSRPSRRSSTGDFGFNSRKSIGRINGSPLAMQMKIEQHNNELANSRASLADADLIEPSFSSSTAAATTAAPITSSSSYHSPSFPPQAPSSPAMITSFATGLSSVFRQEEERGEGRREQRQEQELSSSPLPLPPLPASLAPPKPVTAARAFLAANANANASASKKGQAGHKLTAGGGDNGGGFLDSMTFSKKHAPPPLPHHLPRTPKADMNI